MSIALDIKNLSAAYGATTVLRGIDLSIEDGQITALLGANGAGKTTLLRAISRMMVRTEGPMTFHGTAIDGLRTEQVARLGIGHVPDGRGTFLEMSTEENLLLGTRCRSDKQGIAEDLQDIYSLFPRLKERLKQQAGTLSGGEQQMLAIGRALMGRPRLLLLDEPSFGLAPLVVREVFGVLQQVCSQRQVSILLVEQNAKLALNVAHACYLLEGGSIVASGRADRMRDHPAVRRAYLGEEEAVQ